MDKKFLSLEGLSTLVSLIKGGYAEKTKVNQIEETLTNTASVAAKNAEDITALNTNVEGRTTPAQVDEKINTALGSLTKVTMKKVTSVNEVAEENIIYLVPKTTGKTLNVFDEYMLIDGNAELIGSTEVDLSGYLRTNDVNFASTADIDTMFTA